MATATKSPVDRVEEFLSMQNTRREAAERLATPGSDAPLFSQAKAEAEKAVAQLMNELSQFGDAAKGAGKADNEFNRIWNDTASNIDNMNAQQKEETFVTVESALSAQYAQALKEDGDLPESLRAILEQQAAALEGRNR